MLSKELSIQTRVGRQSKTILIVIFKVLVYEGWNFNSGNYLFTTDTK